MNRIFITILASMLLFSCTSNQERVVKYMNEGLTKISKSDNKGAIEDFSRVIELQPINQEAYYRRACCYFNIKDFTKALNDFNKAIELDPSYADAYYNRALLKNFMHDKEGACIDWRKAVKLGKPNIKDSFEFCH
jgi:tetratricopeptide (TPR) repeat protein